ncbi:G-ACD-00290 [African swine fever virus]|nr:G-ACD-00290 [African swine fever virus]UVH34977.1 G-ACD-00290 [African swine fever virus]UVH35159.1 G-ACD-00290 [African swine fever virus]
MFDLSSILIRGGGPYSSDIIVDY